MTTRIPSRGSRKSQPGQPSDSKRRAPVQNRAKVTLDAIFEAAARILEREGRAGLNTNRIAELAGVSIGTLYQYFRNKEEILVAMARRQFDADTEVALGALQSASSANDEEPARQLIRVLISTYRQRRKTRRVAIDTLVAEGLSRERARAVNTVADAIRLLPEQRQSETALFVITRAVNGVLRATIEEDSELLGTREFEEELVRLVRSYLA